MGLIYVDNFETYTTAYEMIGVWGSHDSVDSGDVTRASAGGPFGEDCVDMTLFSSENIHCFWPGGQRAAEAKTWHSYWLKLETGRAGLSTNLIRIGCDAGGLNTPIISTLPGYGLYHTPSGVLHLYSGATSLNSVSNILFADDSWYHIEVMMKLNNSTSGEYAVYVNGTEVMSDTGLDTVLYSNTSETSALGHSIEGQTLGGGVFLSGLAIWDETNDGRTTDITTGPQGMLRLETLRPNAAGSNTDWTPSTGNNWEAVDDNVPSSTAYVAASSSGNRDTYNFDTITSTGTGNILGVSVSGQFRHAGPVLSYVEGMCVSSNSTTTSSDGAQGSFPQSTESTGSNQAMFHFTGDPSSTLQWSTGGIDSMELGFELRKSTT